MKDEVLNRPNISLPIEGMTCAACVLHVEHALQGTPGVVSAVVNLATEKATVGLKPGTLPLSELRQSVEDAGYSIATADTNLTVGGMTCTACVSHVEHALRGVPGVLDAAVNLATERARVNYVPGLAGVAEFREALETAATGWMELKVMPETRRRSWSGWRAPGRYANTAIGAHSPSPWECCCCWVPCTSCRGRRI